MTLNVTAGDNAALPGSIAPSDDAIRFAMVAPRWIVASPADFAPTVDATTDRGVILAAGSGLICGVPIVNTAPLTVNAAPNTDPSKTRVDALVVELTWTATTNGVAVAKFLTNPNVDNGATLPPLVWTPGTKYQALIAWVSIPPGVGRLAVNNVEDRRTTNGVSGDLVVQGVSSSGHSTSFDAPVGCNVRFLGDGTRFRAAGFGLQWNTPLTANA